MKKVVIFILTILVGNTVVSAQNQTVTNSTAVCVMPDGSTQYIWINATKAVKNEFLSIVSRNSTNTKSITLSQKTFTKNDEKPFLSESTTYRFLANQLCKKCTNVEKVIDKEAGCFLFLKNTSGRYVIDIIYNSQYSTWYLTIVDIDKTKFQFTKEKTVFYL